MCVSNQCVATPADLSMVAPADLAMAAANDLSSGAPNDLSGMPAGDMAGMVTPPPDLAMGGGGKGGCGCRIGGESGPTPPLAFFTIALAFGAVLSRRRANRQRF
jgi:MYXO-CTERM domain-containing protein